MKQQFRARRGSFARLASALAAIPAVMALTVPTAWAAAATALAPYLAASHAREIALARSAAPPSIAGSASVMVLGAHGYFTAVKGTNGFVCLVVRSWDHEVDVKRAEFWNPKFHAPFCLNAAAAQTVLPRYLARTQWVIAGASRKVIGERDQAAWAAGRFEAPKPGALCYMMSRQGDLGDGTPWHPHVMLFFPRGQAPSWGANLRGVPIMAGDGKHITTVFLLVPDWSDGTPALPMPAR